MILRFQPQEKRTPDSDAFNETFRFATLGVSVFTEDATITLRPDSMIPGATAFGQLIAEVRDQANLCHGGEITSDDLHAVDKKTAWLAASFTVYASLAVSGWSDVEALAEPATADDVARAAWTGFSVDVVSASAQVDGKLDPRIVQHTEEGFDLLEGSKCLPFTGRNLFRVLSWFPGLAVEIVTRCKIKQTENFPKLVNPTRSSTTSVSGASSTSKKQKRPRGSKGTRKQDGHHQKPRTGPAN
jgi:hypothetical protein